MGGNIKGITIEFRGETTSLDKALRKINSEANATQRELTSINKALKFNPTSVDLWKQKQQVLNEKIKQTEERQKTLKEALKKMDDSGISHETEEYRRFQRELIETESKLKTFKAQLREIGNANLKALSMQLKEVGDKATSLGKSMTTTVTAPIVAGYTVAANLASDYEENLNKLDVAFGSNSQSVKDWANNAREAYGLSKVQATEAASAFGALGKGIGLSEKDAASMSTTLAGLSADLGSYFNVGTDESSKALEGIFTGESEALKKFGVVMTDTNLKQFAADQGLVWSELDQTEKTMLRYQYVLDKTKDAQGDFARTSDGTANSTKIFKASIQDLGTSIGTNLLPIITPIIQKITEWVNKFNELSPSTQRLITIIGLIAAAIGPVLVILGTLASSIGSIIGLVGMVGPVIAELAAPITLAIGLIAMLITIGVALYKNWDSIKAKAIEIWGSITNVWTSIKTSIQATIETIMSNVTGKFNSLKTTVETVWNNIKSAIINPIQTARDTLTNIVNQIKSWFPINLGKIFNFKTPHINIGSKTVKVGDKDVTVPTFDVQWYAKGGIFDQPTLAGIGEAGPEAVVPLDRFWEEIRNSNARTDALLERQNAILIMVLEELEKEKNFKIDGMWAGRYVNSLVKG